MTLFRPKVNELRLRVDIAGLQQAMFHRRGDVRREAIEALAAIGNEEALRWLAWSLTGRDDECIRGALAAVYSDSSVAYLQSLVLEEGLALNNRVALADLLVSRARSDEGEFLRKLAAHPEMTPEIRARAAEALNREDISARDSSASRGISEEPSRADDRLVGPMGERYCSDKCYELGGQTIARHQIQGWVGDCSVCRGDLRIGPGQSGSMVCYKPGLFLYFHQQPSCESAVRAELAKGSGCVVCGTSVT